MGDGIWFWCGTFVCVFVLVCVCVFVSEVNIMDMDGEDGSKRNDVSTFACCMMFCCGSVWDD